MCARDLDEGLAQDDIESPPFHSIERCYLRFISRGHTRAGQDNPEDRYGVAFVGASGGVRRGGDGDPGEDRRARRAIDDGNGDQDRGGTGCSVGAGVPARRAENDSTDPGRSLLFLVLSGLATGVSWLAYFRALQMAPASLVSPIDKLSLPLTIVLAALWLREPVNWQVGAGVTLMTAGALVIAMESGLVTKAGCPGSRARAPATRVAARLQKAVVRPTRSARGNRARCWCCCRR